MKLNDTNIGAVAAAMHLGEVQLEVWKTLFGLGARESETIKQMMSAGRPEITQSPLAPHFQNYFDRPDQPARVWEFLERPIRLGILWQHAAVAPQRYLTSRLQQLSDLLPYVSTDQTADSTEFLFRLTSMLKVILFDVGLVCEAYRLTQRHCLLAVAESTATSSMFSGSTIVDDASDFQLLPVSPPRAASAKPRETCPFTEDEVRVEVADLDVDENEAGRCKALAGLTKVDIKLLRQLHVSLSAARSQIADAVMGQITSFRDASPRLSDAAGLESLRHAISDSLDRMTSGRLAQKSWGHATHSGVVYSRLGLEMTSLLAVCCKSVVDLLGATHEWLTAEGKPVLPTIRALLKACMVEISIVLEVLIRADARPLLDLQMRARVTVAQLPWAVLTVFPDLRLQSANSAFLRLFGYTSNADLVGQRLDEILPSDDLANHVREFFATRLPRYNLFLDVSTKSGVRHLRVVITGLFQREQVRCLLLIEDCTQVQRLERQRMESVQRWQDLVQDMDAIVWEADPRNGRFLLVSRRAESMLGFPVQTWLSQPNFWASRIHPDDRKRVLKLRRQAIATSSQSDYRYRFRAADNNIVWLEDRLRIHRNTSGIAQLLRGQTVDVTKQTQAAKQQRSLAEQVIAAEEMVRHQIGYDLHDELGQSLTALSMDLSRLESKSDPETVKRLRSVVASAMDELRRLTRGLTSNALDEQGLLEALQQYTAFYSEVHAIPVDMQVGPFPTHRLPHLVERVLYRIVVEALTNVAKHAACKHVELVIECQPTMVQLVVRDDGVGFDREAAVQRTASAAIGLTSMRERTLSLNGSFAVDSQPGQGTSVCVRLPLMQEDL